jgi:glycosyltransferase involved in cell wall biosynthesis
MSLLRHSLNAEIHQPVHHNVTLGDRFWARVFAIDPAQVALGRTLARKLTDQDVVFAAGEDVGFPLALALHTKKQRPRLVIEVHNPRRPRVRFALRYLRLKNVVDLFTVTADHKVDFLLQDLQFRSDQVHLMNQTTDTNFFSPGPPSPDKKRPVIAASGLEHRDYITLAEATADLDVDVRICAVSPNATKRRDAFPEVLPANMKAGFYGWTELRQLYRDADVVAIPLRPNALGAGQTAIMEALACGRPVVTIHARSMVDDYASEGLLYTVPAQNPMALRGVIEDVLKHPDQASVRARRARARVVEDFSNEHWVQHVTALLREPAPDDVATGA